MMKNRKTLAALLTLVIVCSLACKAAGRLAAKYWLKREIREFVTNCEDKATRIIGSENAHKYCDCTVDLVADKFHDYQDAKNLSWIDLLDFINKCK
jgi:hypothetical protein